MRLPTFYEQNLIPNWGNTYKKESPSLAGMTVELAETPLGVDTPAPRFGWQLTAVSQVSDGLSADCAG